MAAGNNKQSWPELLHQRPDYAYSVIRSERPDLDAVGYVEGHDQEPQDRNLNRVIIWEVIDPSNYYVSRVPVIG
ncbi:hypothetical protein PVAP13_8NG185112 [Panicum virgatum]|uniref:Uncharacterized protein n=1 Tax=Panicum virgatum TaxID=38727 RepID=A0A8T0P8B1_PANVG|nr:hypothetical protein PVAP13_8NG185112 [Panicum virgatum]